MIKFGLLICIFIVSFQNGNSQLKRFGKLLGPCPQTKAENSTTLDDIEGKWYIHWVLGPYTPWKFFQCQSNEITTQNNETSSLKTLFALTAASAFFELDGLVQKVNDRTGKFDFDYKTILGNIYQRTVFLQTYNEGAALFWTCLDFQLFHLESLEVATLYQDPDDKNVPDSIFEKMRETVKNAGLSPNDFVAIDQFSCE